MKRRGIVDAVRTVYHHAGRGCTFGVKIVVPISIIAFSSLVHVLARGFIRRVAPTISFGLRFRVP